MTEPPTTKPELLALIDERWAVLQDLIGKMSDEDMERPLGDGWSAKVHVGHIASWERSLLGLLRKHDRAEAMGVPREAWEGHDTDAINALLADAAHGTPLADIRDECEAAHAGLMALLHSMTQEDLELPYSHYQPDDLPYNANAVGGWVHGNTWDHYNEHIGWLEAGLTP